MNDFEVNMSEKLVEIYTDGACRGNPGKGGWGALMSYAGKEKELCGGEHDTTNNRMELTAPIEALTVLKRSCKVKIFTDSQYVRKGITEWIESWQARGWKTAAKKDVKNKDLWLALLEQVKQHDVEWVWVKGHSGVPGNERADDLANRGIDELTDLKESQS